MDSVSQRASVELANRIKEEQLLPIHNELLSLKLIVRILLFYTLKFILFYFFYFSIARGKLHVLRTDEEKK